MGIKLEAWKKSFEIVVSIQLISPTSGDCILFIDELDKSLVSIQLISPTSGDS